MAAAHMPSFAALIQLLDKANEATDRKLARHLVSLYGNGVGRLGSEVRQRCRSCFLARCCATLGRQLRAPRVDPSPQTAIIPMDTLCDYIAYARATCFPSLQPEAANVRAVAYRLLACVLPHGTRTCAHGVHTDDHVHSPLRCTCRRCLRRTWRCAAWA